MVQQLILGTVWQVPMGDCPEQEWDLERMLLSEDNPRSGLSPVHGPGSHTSATDRQRAPAWSPVPKERAEEAKQGCSGAVQTTVWPCRQRIREARVQLDLKLVRNGNSNKQTF